ncbi:MAG TPA: hypothetical protein PKE07_15425 [Lacibacter sp.]|nr:hypothetical protein [Lacibacter sp.]HMO90540.1 hypothetical protein [Lacibacter sp.]
MAIIKVYGSGETRFGKFGGTVITWNKSGLIAIRRKMPIYKLTERNSVIRSNFRHVSQNFRLLSPGQQATFADKKDQFIKINSSGKVKDPPVDSFYNEMAQPLSLAEFPLPTEAIDKLTFPGYIFDLSIFTLSPFSLRLYPDPLLIPSGFAVKIWSTAVNFGTVSSHFPDDYKLISTELVGPVSFFNVSNNWLSAFGPAPAFNPALSDSTSINTVFQLLHIDSGQQEVTDSLTTYVTPF